MTKWRFRFAAIMDPARLDRIWRYIRRNWPYLALFFLIVGPLWWMAASLAIRTRLYTPFGGAPTSQQLSTFLTFIGGGLATAATLYGALLTSSHNRRERRRLQLQAVLESLKTLPEERIEARAGGILVAMVLLGQQSVALRLLNTGMENKILSEDTAAWALDQILNTGYAFDTADGEQLDKFAIDEAASLLRQYAEQGRLTREEPAEVWFPGYFSSGHWNRSLTPYSAEFVLRATAHTLLSQSADWWSGNTRHSLPDFPTQTWIECAKHDSRRTIVASAVSLLGALNRAFPEEEEKRANPTLEKLELRKSAKAIIEQSRHSRAEPIPAIKELAEDIERWAGTGIKPNTHTVAAFGVMPGPQQGR